MVKIPCLECGKSLKIPSYINHEDYDGQFRCNACNSLLYIRFKSSEVRKYKLVEKFIPPSEPIKIVEIIKDYGSGQQVREGDKSEE